MSSTATSSSAYVSATSNNNPNNSKPSINNDSTKISAPKTPMSQINNYNSTMKSSGAVTASSSSSMGSSGKKPLVTASLALASSASTNSSSLASSRLMSPKTTTLQYTTYNNNNKSMQSPLIQAAVNNIPPRVDTTASTSANLAYMISTPMSPTFRSSATQPSYGASSSGGGGGGVGGNANKKESVVQEEITIQQLTISGYSDNNAGNSTGTASSLLNTFPSLVISKEQQQQTTTTTTNETCVGSGPQAPPPPPPATQPSLVVERQIDPLIAQKRVDDFELLTTVGTGTFGRVILVRHKVTKGYYALKLMSITEVIRLKQIEHVRNEKDILSLVNHPFIINFFWTTHNDTFLYMLLEYVCGGELFSYLRNAVKFPNDTANFFAAEITSALEYLHTLSIVYRDLKPENLLLDQQGHVKLCDFGFAKRSAERTFTLCGTPEYLAPEIIAGKGHHKAVDWWALGVLIYEMLAGYPPFFDDNPFKIYQKILAGKVEVPSHVMGTARDLIKRLLVIDKSRRLGSMKNGPEDVKAHRWFKGIDWEALVQRKLPPPIVPKISHEGDTRNFDKYEEEGWKTSSSAPTESAKYFDDF